MILKGSTEIHYYDDIVPSLRRTKVQLLITMNCNYNCSFCQVKHRGNLNNKNYDVISRENIDHIVTMMGNRYNVLTISGGECTLYPDILQYICNECKKKGILTIVYTNGWWGNNKEMLYKMKNVIQPNYIGISYNNEMKYEPIANIIKEFDDNCVKTKIYFNRVITRLVKKIDNPQYYSSFKKIGKTTILHENEVEDYPTFCEFDGVRIMPNGDVEAYCTGDTCKDVCKFGNIKDYTSIHEIIAKRINTNICILSRKTPSLMVRLIAKFSLLLRYIPLIAWHLFGFTKKNKNEI